MVGIGGMVTMPIIDPKAPIDRCPYCGSSEGYYSKDYMYGPSRCYRNYNGEEAYNGEMYDSLNQNQGKYAYCAECHKRLFKMSELVKS